jgi:general secretion pathway protein C
MNTVPLTLKSPLLYNAFYLLITLASVICILITIHSGYALWVENSALREHTDIISKVNKTSGIYKWNLSSVATETSEMTTLTPKEDVLSGVHLYGIIHSTDRLVSRAILDEDGQQSSYAINDRLKSSSNVRVANITKNKVIFSSEGHTQQLTLLDDLIASSVSANQETHQATAALSDFIETNPVFDKNALRGLRLLPRNKATLFSRASLEPGDVAIKINNVSLTQQANIEKAQEMLKHLQMAQLTLLRNASPRVINVSVHQFQDGKEN